MEKMEEACRITLYTDNLNNADGWAKLGKTLSRAPGCVHLLWSERDSLRGAKKKDLKKVWDSLGYVWVIAWVQEGKSKSKWFYKESSQKKFLGWKDLK